MAKGRKVVADQNSAELDQLRRAVNGLLVVLENISTQVDAATITATEGFVALGLTINTGLDSTVATINGGANTYTGTGIALEGLIPTPKHPKRPQSAMAVDALDSTDL
jgi:hypothetical protein